jgi:hypothetical protein
MIKMPTKTRKRNKKLKDKWVIASVLVAIILGVPVAVIEVINYENSLPSPKLDVKNYGFYVNTTLSEDNATYIGLKPTFPSYITNIGNVPVHIVVCDVYLSQNGKPSNLSGESISEIAYLKPEDSISYNFTKYFEVSIPVHTLTVGDVTNYLLLVGYYTQNLNDIKWLWVNPYPLT